MELLTLQKGDEMKAEEWLTIFYKDLWTSPKDDRGRRGDTNGSLLANRAEVESLLIASKKSFWQTLSQYVVTHKGAASVLAVSCMTLLGGGAYFCLAFPSFTSATDVIPCGSFVKQSDWSNVFLRQV